MFELFLMLAIGGTFVFIGFRIWKKEQITLIHDYHYSNVSAQDKKPYTEQMGKACIIMGIGMLLTGIVDFMTKTSYGWVCFIVSFIWGMTMIVKAQKKYNGGIF